MRFFVNFHTPPVLLGGFGLDRVQARSKHEARQSAVLLCGALRARFARVTSVRMLALQKRPFGPHLDIHCVWGRARGDGQGLRDASGKDTRGRCEAEVASPSSAGALRALRARRSPGLPPETARNAGRMKRTAEPETARPKKETSTVCRTNGKTTQNARQRPRTCGGYLTR